MRADCSVSAAVGEDCRECVEGVDVADMECAAGAELEEGSEWER